MGTNFRKLVFDHENRENICPAKISHYEIHSSMLTKLYLKKKLQGFGTSTSSTFQLTLSFLGWVWALELGKGEIVW